jgi:hypothetical protein
MAVVLTGVLVAVVVVVVVVVGKKDGIEASPPPAGLVPSYARWIGTHNSYKINPPEQLIQIVGALIGSTATRLWRISLRKG